MGNRSFIKKYFFNCFSVILCSIVIFSVLFSGCIEEKKEPVAEMGDSVSIELVGKFENGTVFNNTTGGNKISFIIGSETQIEGLEEQIIGMKLNETKDFTLRLKYFDNKVRQYPKEFVEQSGIENIKEGDSVIMSTNRGYQTGIIKAVYENGSVDIDLNDPLAGKDLNFNVRLVELTKNETVENDETKKE